MWNIESSFVWNAFHAQAEYTGASVDRVTLPNVTFNGWYVRAGWFITGESRNYDTKSAQFKRITPKHRYGAWEVALRYSAIDLQTKDILGGEQDDVTVGLNWWVNANVMFRFNYVRAMMDPTAIQLASNPPPAAQPPGAGTVQSLNAFMGRVQIVF
jgi:phosphate-selective porin OprO/OprP